MVFLTQETLLILLQSSRNLPSCINGDLALDRKANVKLIMSHYVVEDLGGLWLPTPSSMRHDKFSCGALLPLLRGFTCTDLECPCGTQPPQFNWVCVTIRMAAIGFDF